MKQDYNKTINLPATEFSMRGNLPAKEPGILKKWQDSDLYAQILEKNKDLPSFILHDGPPYANGDIHIGHALNKCLKDFVVRSKNQSGFKSPFVPGYDTHGLPIESQAIKKLGVDRHSVSAIEFREMCKDFALHYAKNQTEQFQRLGVLGLWSDPYYTLKPEFEAKQIRIFGDMAKKGYIYKGLRPVYWCPHDETALAEAEIEYANDPCITVYVRFNVKDDLGKLFDATGLKEICFLIWTTTIWTLPGNVAICINPEFDYSVVDIGGVGHIVASEMVKDLMEMAGIEEYKEVLKIKGAELEYARCQHPFLDRDSLVIVGDHVTTEAGTGAVHTAGGHGAEDFEICKKYDELPIIVPVDGMGKMTKEAGDFIEGMSTDDANIAILKHLAHSGHLFFKKKISHQYPHCWRCKTPILYRVTEQWFCSVENFRDTALDAIKNVKWIPAWGEDRISSMVQDRNDWCISRQRLWGVPIPIFFCKDCDKYIVNDETIDIVANLFEKEGGDAWYKYEASEILPSGFKCPDCGGTHFRKETDIMDVWFDSGSSHISVLETYPSLSWPADMYLEGHDQHRGWFQSSLLTSAAVRGTAPYRSVLTCGFVVDGEGKKMSKSLGNGIEPKEIIDQFGADIVRLWVASSDYSSDVRISKEIIKQLTDVYKKIRNTARYILGNLDGFDPKIDMVPVSEMLELDRYALHRLNEVVGKVRKAYDDYAFYLTYHAIHNYCVVDLSNFYLDIIKDRLYCEGASSFERRSAQSAMLIILQKITVLLAPILSYTTEEIWSYLPQVDGFDRESVMLNQFPSDEKIDNVNAERWEKILLLRDDVKKSLENLRESKVIGSSLEGAVKITANEEAFAFLSGMEEELETIFIVSKVEIVKGDVEESDDLTFKGIAIEASAAYGEKCERCWKICELGKDDKHPTLCPRCAKVVG